MSIFCIVLACLHDKHVMHLLTHKHKDSYHPSVNWTGVAVVVVVAGT